MTTLDQEKFDTLKELAEMQTAISQGNAELRKLKETTEEYLVVREGEAEQRVIEVLKKSREALEATTSNHDELSSYKGELNAFANELSELSSGIAALFKDFNTRVREADKDMEDHLVAVGEVLKQTKVAKSDVESQRKVLALERAEIRDGWRLLKDRQQTLKEGFEELKAKNK
jgi:chromosome segregation ATPase